MKLSGITIILLLLAGSITAQRVCLTPANDSRINSLSTAKPNNDSEQSFTARDTVANEIITIPVVIHIIFNTAAQNISDAQVMSQLKVLNEDFRRLNADAVNTPAAFRNVAADTKIMFCLAQVDPRGRPTKGIIRRYTNKEYFLGDDGMKYTLAGGDDAWDSKKYLNIWVCNLFGRSLGYATPPGGQADKDGVVINFDVFGTVGNLRAPFNKGRTATHEIGHWMGLKHLWGDANCGSDDVEDTPSQANYNFNCPSFPHLSACSPNINGDMFMNFMDFTDDACMNMFTTGQKIKMRSLFAINRSKNSFLNSFACDSTLATGAPLPDDTIPAVKPAPSISVYPNPVQAYVNIAPVDGYELKGKTAVVFSMSGVKMIQKVLTNTNEKINMMSLPAGVYILSIGEGNERKITKLIKI